MRTFYEIDKEVCDDVKGEITEKIKSESKWIRKYIKKQDINLVFFNFI